MEELERPPARRVNRGGGEDFHQGGPDSRIMKAGDVARKLKSFEHFIYLYGQKAGYYLPPKHVLSWTYIAQILAEEKILLRSVDVGSILVLPKCRGMMIDEVWSKYKDSNQLHRYFPNFSDASRIPRDYFFNVHSKGLEGREPPGPFSGHEVPERELQDAHPGKQ